ncbi:uncharacterized protein DS421_15g497640 [Arachis hypogaea]|nr:uncharacterized protein DS421_15g497640 [Arachis hypogaea]
MRMCSSVFYFLFFFTRVIVDYLTSFQFFIVLKNIFQNSKSVTKLPFSMHIRRDQYVYTLLYLLI